MKASGLITAVTLAAGLSLTQAFAQTTGIEQTLGNHVDDALENCLLAGQAELQTPNTDRLLAMMAAATADTQMGTYLIDTPNNSADFGFCLVDDDRQIGTSRARISQDMTYYTWFGTVSSDPDVYPDGITQDQREALQAFAVLEEYAHALTTMGLMMNSGHDLTNFAPMYPVRDVIKKLWADEALASTAAVIAAREQYEAGNTVLWDALQEFEIYRDVIAAVDTAATDNPVSLTDGTALAAGYAAWMNTPALRFRAADKVADIYEQAMENFQSQGAPTLQFRFAPDNILEMAAALKAYDVFSRSPGLTYGVMDDRMFVGMDPAIEQRLQQIEQRAIAYEQQRNGVQPAQPQP